MKKILLTILFVFSLTVRSYSDDNIGIANFIDDFSTKFENINKNSKNKEKDIYNLANEILDLNWMGNFILGQHRKTLSEDKKEKFIEYYSKSLIKNYISVLDVYKKDSYKILTIEETKRKDTFNVETNIKLKDKEVNNTFRIVKKNNKYYITDIITEGISFISSQRSEVNSIISSRGFDTFLKELEAKDNGSN